jgi:hypothetical protein
MNLPQFPTDNMYKFMAIFGLTIVIGTYLIVNWEISNRLLEQINLERSKLKYETDKDFLTAKQTFINGELDRLEKEGIPDSQAYNSNAAEYNKVTEQVINNEKNKVLESEFQKVKSDIKILHEILQFGSIAGLGFTIIGFILWYFKLQRFQDKLTALEARRRESKAYHK